MNLKQFAAQLERHETAITMLGMLMSTQVRLLGDLVARPTQAEVEGERPARKGRRAMPPAARTTVRAKVGRSSDAVLRGRYMGYMRFASPAKKARAKRIRAEKGISEAIQFLQS